MTIAPVSPLRQRMIEDMTIRQFGAKTQQDYVRVVADFAQFLGCPPAQAEPEDLRRYQLHLAAFGGLAGEDERRGLSLAVLLQGYALPAAVRRSPDAGALA